MPKIADNLARIAQAMQKPDEDRQLRIVRAMYSIQRHAIADGAEESDLRSLATDIVDALDRK